MPESKDNRNPAYWTPERRVEVRIRGEAHALCKQKQFAKARDLMGQHNYSWPPFPSTPREPSERVVSDAFRQAVRQNGAKGGRPEKIITLAAPEETEKLIDHVANAVVKNGNLAIRKDPKLAPLTNRDREAIQRLCGLTADEFNAKMAVKLADFADAVLERMWEKLENDQFKSGELPFTFAVAMDKRQHLDGRNALAGANVSIQVNNFNGNGKTKEQLIKSLLGEDEKPAIPV